MRLLKLRRESGAVVPLTAVMLLGLLAVAALVIDGGLLFAERRDLQGMADGAARAGAMAINEELLRDDGAVRLDPSAPEQRPRATWKPQASREMPRSTRICSV